MKNILVSLFILLNIANIIFAGSDKIGTTSANFLKIGYGARAGAMGEAFTAVADDMASIYYNPAGLLNLNKNNISFMHLKWIEGIDYDWISYLWNLSYNQKIGITFSYLNYGDIQKTLEDASGNYAGSAGNYDASDKMMILTYSSLYKEIPFGLNFKLLKQEIDLESATGFAFDIGFKYKASLLPLRYGVMIQNIGKMSKFRYEDDPLPWNIRAGIMYPLYFINLTTAFDIIYPSDNSIYANLGLEYALPFQSLKIFIRSGYSTLSSNNNDRKGYSVGFGVNFNDFNFDYAFQPFDLFDNTHKFSLGYAFGKPKLEKVKIETFDITKEKIASIKKTVQNGYTTRIVYYNPNAKKVTVTGPFNNWDLTNYKLVKNKKGYWIFDFRLPAGRYFYKLNVDGELIPDPYNSEMIPDGISGFNSILYISE